MTYNGQGCWLSRCDDADCDITLCKPVDFDAVIVKVIPEFAERTADDHPMTTTARTQQRYDHRLRDLVQGFNPNA
jgi:hypothetical protein